MSLTIYLFINSYCAIFVSELAWNYTNSNSTNLGWWLSIEKAQWVCLKGYSRVFVICFMLDKLCTNG